MLTRILIAIPAGILLGFAALGVNALVNAPDYCPNLATLARDGVVVWQNERTGNTNCITLETYHERRG